jgi:hypothetical protein
MFVCEREREKERKKEREGKIQKDRKRKEKMFCKCCYSQKRIGSADFDKLIIIQGTTMEY